MINKLIILSQEQPYSFDLKDYDEISSFRKVTNHSKIKKYRHKPTGAFVAIKYINKPNSCQDTKVKKEIELNKSLLNAKNIVSFYGTCLLPDEILICMEFMDMSLTDFYIEAHQKTNNLFPEDLLGCIGVSILDALIACKKEKIIHRDVKPDNVLINRTGYIKLCDFGESRILVDSLATTIVGTLRYWPPEHFDRGYEEYCFDIRADIWSLGITLLEVIAGRYPLTNKNLDHFGIIQEAVRNTKGTQILEKWCQNCSLDIKNFLQLCLETQDKRPKYSDLQNTEFYTKYTTINHPENVSQLIRKIMDSD